MPLVSVSKASKLFDVSRPTLQKALKDGTITGNKVIAGGSESWQIDTAELARLYKLRNPEPESLPDNPQADGQPLATDKPAETEGLSSEVVRGLQEQLQSVQAELDALRTSKAEADRQLAAAQAVAEERKRIIDQVLMLPKPDEQPARKSLWQRIFTR